MQLLRELLRWAGSSLGRAGQPGYLVLALSRQELIVPILRTLHLSQRQALARDWKAGHNLLLDQLRLLRREVHELKRKNRFARALRTAAFAVIDNPLVLVLILAVIALDIAYYNTIRMIFWSVTIPEILAVGAFILTKILWSWWRLRPIPLSAPGATKTSRRRSKTKSTVSAQPPA
jgi:hypothetical protein